MADKTCVICSQPIGVDKLYDEYGILRGTWDGGHNAEPISQGKCCEPCNDEIVTPERLRRVFSRNERG